MKPHVTIYCDGACIGNPGPGGYAALLMTKKNDPNERVVCGQEPETTNNRMELRGAIEGIRALRRACMVTIYCDSQYVIKGMTEWLPSWQLSQFKTSARKEVKNKDLWVELAEVSKPHEIAWRWVRGHAGNEYNERVDEIAREQAGLALHQLRKG